MECPIVIRKMTLPGGTPMHIFEVQGLEGGKDHAFTLAAEGAIFGSDHRTGALNRAIEALQLPKPRQ